MNLLPTECPSCQQRLKVSRLQCSACETMVAGNYQLPTLASLSSEDQQFVVQFVTVGGSLKEMARYLKVSYPTVRNRLDQVIERIQGISTTEGE